jgi:hypothetical protein
MDIKPLQLNVDMRIIDRMELAITTFINRTKKREVTSTAGRSVEERLAKTQQKKYYSFIDFALRKGTLDKQVKEISMLISSKHLRIPN